MGLWFLFDGIRFYLIGSDWNEFIAGFLGGISENERVWGFYRAFADGFLVANADFVASFILAGFAIIGVGLTLGVMTRFCALFGLFLNLNFVVGRGFMLLGAHVDAWFLIAEVAILLSASGRTFGLDGHLLKKWPRARLLMGASN